MITLSSDLCFEISQVMLINDFKQHKSVSNLLVSLVTLTNTKHKITMYVIRKLRKQFTRFLVITCPQNITNPQV